MNCVNFTSQCGLLNREKIEKTFETSGGVITFETKLYMLLSALTLAETLGNKFDNIIKTDKVNPVSSFEPGST